MALPGKFGVSGAATYNIPIAVPPGTAGMTPPLSLSFSSLGNNGIVGMGWSLSGLLSITRCPQTFAQDGVRGGVNFDSNDRFCLDGQRLVVISGGYGADGAEYRTEIESFNRVISHGAAGNGPAWFEVHTKSGQIMEFGNTADSLVLAQGKPTARSWAVNKVSDTKGNYYTVTYTNDTTNGQAYPIEIDYTGNAAAGLAPYNQVKFVYATRPDITPAYQAGSLVQTTVRLSDVETYAGGNLVLDYRLAYDTSITNLSSLISVTACAADGSCLPATSFNPTYGSGGTFNAGTFTYPNGWNFGSPPSAPTQSYAPIVGDFNGDGKTDFAFAAGTLLYVMLSNGDGTFSASTYTYPNGWNLGAPPTLYFAPIVGDFNGDGKTDFAFAGDTHTIVFLSNGDGTFSAVWYNYPNGWNFGAPPTQSYTPLVGDFNGDGKTDFALAAGTEIFVFLSNGDGTFSGSTFVYPNGWNFGSPYNPNNCGGSACWATLVGDFNGDGKTDFIFYSAGYVFGNVLYVMLSNGDGTFTASTFTLPNGWSVRFTYLPIVGDFNGDGLTDIAFAYDEGNISGSNNSVYVMLSKGDGTFAGVLWNLPQASWIWAVDSIITGDFNGDGRTDFAFVEPTEILLMLSNGDGTFSASAYTYPNGWGWSNFGSPLGPYYTPIVGDFNGDGKTDFAAAEGTLAYTFLAAGPPFYQLNAVTNGLGATTTFTYQPLTNGSVYTKDTTSTYPIADVQAPINVVSQVNVPNGQSGTSASTSTYPLVNVQGPTYVVSRVDSSNGVGGTYSATYSYAGAKADLSGRGFLGFRQVTATDLLTNIVATTNARQDYPYIGLTASETKTLGSLTLNSTTNTYQFSNSGGAATISTPTNASAPYQVTLSQTVAASFDLDGSAIPPVTTTYQFDAYGNPTQIVASTPDGFSKTTTNTYTNDTINWFLGRLTGASVTSTTP